MASRHTSSLELLVLLFPRAQPLEREHPGWWLLLHSSGGWADSEALKQVPGGRVAQAWGRQQDASHRLRWGCF